MWEEYNLTEEQIATIEGHDEGNAEWQCLGDEDRLDPADIEQSDWEEAQPCPPAGDGCVEQYLGPVGVKQEYEWMRHKDEAENKLYLSDF